MKFPLSVTITRVEKKFSEKKQRSYCQVRFAGLGFSFQTIVPERLVPDMIEGKEVQLVCEVTADRFLNPSFRVVALG